MIFFVALMLGGPAAALASIGAISSISGSVYYKAREAAKWAVAAKGTGLNIGDRLKTGADGRVLLKFEDGTNLSLGNESEIEITEFLLKKDKRSATYTLSTGKVRALVNKFNGKTDIKVKTATSTSGVKGTDFIVMNQGNANVIFGEESTVDVSTPDKDKSVDLKAGAMTENTRGANPIEPVKVDPGTALADARAELEAVTDVSAPVEWEKTGKLPDILARWNINYGHYLADSKRFADSLDVFQIAIDLTSLAAIKAESYIERGTVLSRNLNEPQKALQEYMTVVDKYNVAPFAENALFSAGMIYMDLGDKENARKLFKRYLSEYPEGSHRPTIELFMKELESR